MESLRKKPLIVIVGETGTGKTSTAIYLAKKFNGEIISADSWAVYKDFDIGTAKPSEKEQKQIKHHLIDIADPVKGFSAAEFKVLCELAIKDIELRGKQPIIVGGTGLYIDSVVYNYSFLPAGDPEKRKSLDSMNLDRLKEMANNLSIDSSGIDVNNKRRLIRLIENKGIRPTKSSINSNILILGISTNELSTMVEKRVDEMIKNGLVDEVRKLSDKYGWDIEPMKGTGYKEFRDYFAGLKNINQTKLDIIRNTLKLAKKQRTWFRRNNSIQWVFNRDQIVDIVTTHLNKF